MRAISWAAAVVLFAGATANTPPAWAYYSDDHIWDREYQSGSEWRVKQAARPLPWVASSAWNRGMPDAPAGSWWQGATPVAPGYVAVSPEWIQTSNRPQPWEQMAWNVPWWNPQAPLMTNHRYQQAVFDSSQNPYSNQGLNAGLGAAAAHGDVRLVQALMSHGADHNARDGEGFTALTWAAQFGRYEVLEYLLARHSHVNVVDRWGYTPLMWALQQGHVAAAALLLSRGANPAISTPFGITPRVLATYAAQGVARGLIEDALAGKPVRLEAYQNAAPTPQGAVPNPSNGNTAPGQSVWVAGGENPQATQPKSAGVLEPEPLLIPSVSSAKNQSSDGLGPLTPLPMAGRFKRMDEEAGWQRIAAIAGYFGTSYHRFVLEKHQRTLENKGVTAEADPDERVGVALGRTFGRALQTRNPDQARLAVERLKRDVQFHTRFLPFLTAFDETLHAMGH